MAYFQFCADSTATCNFHVKNTECFYKYQNLTIRNVYHRHSYKNNINNNNNNNNNNNKFMKRHNAVRQLQRR